MSIGTMPVVSSKLARSDDDDTKFIALIDVYTFATQVLARHLNDGSWNTVPSISVLRRGGRIISANKLAKDIGITNDIKRKEAECIARARGIGLKIFVQPAYGSGKPDQTLLRQAGYEVLEIIKEYTRSWEHPPVIEWIPQDETYLDISEQVNYMVANNLHNRRVSLENVAMCLLAIAVPRRPEWPLMQFPKEKQKEVIKLKHSESPADRKVATAIDLINGLLKRIQEQSLLHCSGGIGSNKMLAKIACTLNPPGSLNFFGKTGIPKKENSERVPLKKLAQLSSQSKAILEFYDISTMGRLQDTSIQFLMRIGLSKEDAILAKLVSRGFDDRSVQHKIYSNNISAGRGFGRPLTTYKQTKYELKWLIKEFLVRLEEEKERHGRIPSRIQVTARHETFQDADGKDRNSKTVPLTEDSLRRINWIVAQLRGPITHGIERLSISGLRMHDGIRTDFQNGANYSMKY